MNLPIAERELRVASRNPKIFRARMAVTLCFSAVLAWFLWATRDAFSQSSGASAFIAITNITLIVCMFSSNSTADLISSEKRGGTLGFLFLTDLKGRDVIFGKLAAVGLIWFYTLLGLIPMLSILMLMGGLTGQTIFRSSLVLLNALFFSLSIGIWVSTKHWEQKKAHQASAWRIMLFLWGFPMLGAIAEFQLRWKHVGAVLQILSPAFQLQGANPPGFIVVADRFWISLIAIHGLAWLALWRACCVVPHAWQDRPAPIRGRFKEWWSNVRLGTSEQRAALRRSLLDLNAMHWLSSRDRWTRASMWIFFSTLALMWIGLWIWIAVIDSRPPPFWGPGIPMIFVAQIGVILKAASVSTEALERDRFSGALELLLSTSLSISDIAAGIWMSVWRAVLKPAAVTFVVGTILFFFAVKDADRDADFLYLTYLCVTVLFVALLFAAVQTGMWTACVSKKIGTAAGMVILRLGVVPFILFLITMSLINFLNLEFLYLRHEDVTGYFVCFAYFLGGAIFWYRRSKRCFKERLRLIATERFLAPASKSSIL